MIVVLVGEKGTFHCSWQGREVYCRALAPCPKRVEMPHSLSRNVRSCGASQDDSGATPLGALKHSSRT